jgi:8-hydroxy-5-deazaflavin:NADPH oxidoreductase
MKIVMLGAGHVARALGEGWGKSGHEITYAVRDPASRNALAAKDLGANVQRLDSGVTDADAVVIAVGWDAVERTLKAVGELSGKIVIDATNALGAKPEIDADGRISAGEIVARLAPGAKVVKAFNTTGWENMADSHYAGGRPIMLIAGDDAGAKASVARLAELLGFEPIDAGMLRAARQLEAVATLWIHLAYRQGLGRDIAFALLRR